MANAPPPESGGGGVVVATAASEDGAVISLRRSGRRAKAAAVLALAPVHEQQLRGVVDRVTALQAGMRTLQEQNERITSVIRDQGTHLNAAIQARQAFQLDRREHEMLGSAFVLFLIAGSICLLTGLITLVWLPWEAMHWLPTMVCKAGGLVATGVFLFLYGGTLAASRWIR
jgi:hypothetical protein